MPHRLQFQNFTVSFSRLLIGWLLWQEGFCPCTLKICTVATSLIVISLVVVLTNFDLSINSLHSKKKWEIYIENGINHW